MWNIIYEKSYIICEINYSYSCFVIKYSIFCIIMDSKNIDFIKLFIIFLSDYVLI